MKAHIVFTHPNLQSFNGQMRNVAIQALEELGWIVSVSDLHQMKFKASADEEDFASLYNDDFFDLQKEQSMALQNHSFSEDIKREHQLLHEADLVIFQFPLWWESMPALMKGYIDRVFSMGWAYGGGKALAGKSVLVSTTTGAPDFVWIPENRWTIKDTFKHLFIGTFGLCGMQSLEPFIAYGAKRMSEENKKMTFEKYKRYLKAVSENLETVSVNY
jgi:NAD(P)H dehydrogenase (quinone)